MKRQLINVLLILALALGLCAGALAAEAADGAISVSGLPGGQYAFVAGYDETGRFLGARVLTADGDAQPIPGAAEMKLFRTDSQFAPQGEAVNLSQDFRVRKVDGRVALYYEGPDGVTVTQPVTEKITGTVTSYSLKGELTIHSTFYTVTTLTVEGCDYTVSREGFQHWSDQPGLPFNDTLDFYLDPWGNICWIDLAAEYVYPVETRLLLSVGVTETSGGTAVRAELMRPNGFVSTLDVTILDGRPITDPDAAVAQLSANAPGGFYDCRQQRDDTYSLTATHNAPDSGWGQTLTIPPDTITAPAADFTGGAVDCLANDETIFVLSRGMPGEEEVTRWVGCRDLPAVTVWEGTVVTAEGDPTVTPVARFVYLRTLDVEPPPPPPPVELPDGYIFLADNSSSSDPELFYDGVCLVPIVDTDSTRTSMRVSAGLGLGISYDSMEVGRFADNFYVGKFCAVTEINEYAVVSALAPVTADDVTAFGNNVITTSARSWGYDDATYCIYVDLRWEDMNGDGVRDDADQVTLADFGTFSPNSFFDPGDVSADPADGTFYRSVRAAVIPSAEDLDRANYIYIVRELW